MFYVCFFLTNESHFINLLLSKIRSHSSCMFWIKDVLMQCGGHGTQPESPHIVHAKVGHPISSKAFIKGRPLPGEFPNI